MSNFDDALAMSDAAVFAEMGDSIIINGLSILAIEGASGKNGIRFDSPGGISKIASFLVTVFWLELMVVAGSSDVVGLPATIGTFPSSQEYFIDNYQRNGATVTLFLMANEGTGGF